MPEIRVFLVDAQEVTRRGVAAVLESDSRIRVVGEAGSVGEARRRIPAVRPDVAVVPAGRLCADLSAAVPGLRCLVLGQDGAGHAVGAALRGGAAGFLVRDVGGAELVAAVLRVAAGESLFDAATLALTHSSDGHPRDRLELLTDREREVLRLLGEGLRNRDIAERLGLADKTVKNYVTRLLAKLELANRTQAAVLATHLRDGAGGAYR